MRTEFLRPIDGLRLPEEYRALLRPGESEAGANGTVHRLPRFFYEIGSWEEAHEIRLAPHFTLAELMLVDCREAQASPKPVPSLRTVCNPFACQIPGGRSGAKSTRRCSSAQTADTARRRIRLEAQKAFMRGVQRQISTGLAILFCPTRSRLRNIGRSQRRLVRLFLFGHSDVKKDRPATTSTSI